MWIIILPCVAVQTCTVQQNEYADAELENVPPSVTNKACPAGDISLKAAGTEAETSCDLKCKSGYHRTDVDPTHGTIALTCSPGNYNQQEGSYSLSDIACAGELYN